MINYKDVLGKNICLIIRWIEVEWIDWLISYIDIEFIV